jgi:hypothetical protein
MYSSDDIHKLYYEKVKLPESYFTPLHISNAQSASPCSVITAHFAGVLKM